MIQRTSLSRRKTDINFDCGLKKLALISWCRMEYYYALFLICKNFTPPKSNSYIWNTILNLEIGTDLNTWFKDIREKEQRKMSKEPTIELRM